MDKELPELPSMRNKSVDQVVSAITRMHLDGEIRGMVVVMLGEESRVSVEWTCDELSCPYPALTLLGAVQVGMEILSDEVLRSKEKD